MWVERFGEFEQTIESVEGFACAVVTRNCNSQTAGNKAAVFLLLFFKYIAKLSDLDRGFECQVLSFESRSPPLGVELKT